MEPPRHSLEGEKVFLYQRKDSLDVLGVHPLQLQELGKIGMDGFRGCNILIPGHYVIPGRDGRGEQRGRGGLTFKDGHPAFRCGRKRIREIWFSKYLNTVVAGRAASLPMAQPYNARNIEQASQMISHKGTGWCLVPFSLRAAINLKCLREGHVPSGNTDIGHDYYNMNEVGTMTESGAALTGSGPLAWTHNGSPEGIWDLVGNLNEWDCGLRLMDGELPLIHISEPTRH